MPFRFLLNQFEHWIQPRDVFRFDDHDDYPSGKIDRCELKVDIQYNNTTLLDKNTNFIVVSHANDCKITVCWCGPRGENRVGNW